MMIYSEDGKWVIGGLVGHRVVMLRWPIPVFRKVGDEK
jgi:hypothetical protein